MPAQNKIDFAQDIKTQLTNLLQQHGYSIDENHPQPLTGFTGETLVWRWGWNVALQFFNARRRSLTAGPRTVYWAQELRDRPISADVKAAIDLIIAESEAGAVLTRFMTTSIQDASCSDHLLNDWGIVHFHLGNPIPNKNSLRTQLATFVTRTGPLLFAFPTASSLYLIDILPHGSWAEIDMINILHRNWPDMMAQYRPPGGGSTHLRPDSEMIKAFRRGGVTYAVVVSDGTSYLPPGEGYMSDGSSVDAVRRANNLFNTIRQLEEYLKENSDTYIEKINSQLNTSISRLDLSFYYEDGLFKILETQTNCLLWQKSL